MTPNDPLLERLRRLPRPKLDDVAAARTLARAEAAFAAAHATTESRSRFAGWPVPAALALWGALYAWGALGELGRLYPANLETVPAVALRHRGPSRIDTGAQFMLNAISKTSARTTPTMTYVPPLLDSLRATSFSIAVPVWSEVSSDMDPSMQVVDCDTRLNERSGATFGAGRGTIAARRAASTARAMTQSHARAPTEPAASRRSGA
jgi:hypothetical protein